MKLNNNDDSHNSGLNLLIYNMLLDIESHPAWVCGLKRSFIYKTQSVDKVTPCVGVWIETSVTLSGKNIKLVTPCVGVWIETTFCRDMIKHKKSHPAWVCGLKPIVYGSCKLLDIVTPCVGVWIETDIV